MTPYQMVRSHPRAVRILASTLALLFLGHVIFPTAVWALSSGPAQPEFTSFEPVATSTMVNEFTGDFTYNLPILEVPGPNGGGHALSLSYHAGASPEEEATWVGYGWTLNPGAINRQVMGIPDDWNGEDIRRWNKAPPVTTVSAGLDLGVELFSGNLGIGANAMLRYNNYQGFGYAVGAGLAFAQGVVSLGYNVSDGEGSFTPSVNPAQLLGSNAPQWAKTGLLVSGGVGNAYGIHALTAKTYPMGAVQMSGSVSSVSISAMVTPPPAQVGVQIGAFGRVAVQTPEPTLDRPAYGFLYSREADGTDERMMDYHTENPSTFNKRDKFLPPSFSDPDLYVVSGEGVGGGMSLHRGKVGHFRPDHTLSISDFNSEGVEFQGGLSTGPGISESTGSQSLTVRGWGHPITDDRIDEPYFFRMSNDLGGHVQYSSNSSPSNVYLFPPTGVPGAKDLNVDFGQYAAALQGRSDRSTHVGFSKAGTVDPSQSNYSELAVANVYERSDLTNETIDLQGDMSTFSRSDLNEDHIAEFSVTNEAGQRSNYGLPLYARSEKNLSYSAADAPNLTTYNNTRATADDPEGCSSKNGTEAGAAGTKGNYASQYLLTSITDADYVDRGNDGPTPDDLGGYTKFIYGQQYGSSDKGGEQSWYRWRMPYNGYAYDRGEISECYDDRISYFSGEREVYYLHEIRTKTHVAKFVLNDAPREDAVGASSGISAGSDLASHDPDQKLRYLKRIDLYTIEAYENSEAPTRSVLFEYDYECWPGVPNNVDIGTGDKGTGKLTLKKVWFEHNGVIEARIAPYEFHYSYPAPATYPAVYQDLQLNGLDEEPNYDPYATEGWGAYASAGAARADAETAWLDQYPAATFDPAAWQLKRIRLPSGGEIHVQYEQDDYLHVQADRAHTMVPILNNGSDPAHGLAEILIPGSACGSTLSSDIQNWAQLISNEYVGQQKKMYFKLRFRLRDDGTGWRNFENVMGYARVASVAVVGTNVQIAFVTGDRTRPVDLCRDLFNAQKRGKRFNGDCTAALFASEFQSSVSGSTTPSNAVTDFIDALGSDNVMDILTVGNCSQLDQGNSYLRLPVLKRKLGGGLRVKRLMMYAPQASTNDGQTALYGSEYIYSEYDGERDILASTGVATNEPTSFREENILVRSVDRYAQGWWDKAIGGRDLKTTEGPIGESVYPGPSVGYRRVIVRNISETLPHFADPENCPAPPGFSVTEFYTAFDYPIITDEPTSLTAPGAHRKDLLFLPALFYNRIVDKHWMTQGFTIRLNSMHGQLRSHTSYGGLAMAFLGGTGTPSANAPMGERTSYEYFAPGENVPVWKGPQNDQVELLPLGQEMNITMEDRSIVDRMDDRVVEVDLSLAVMGIIPLLLFGTGYVNTVSHTEVRTHTTTKVVRYPAIVKRVTTYEKGIFHVAQNLAFDGSSGEPLIVRTHDGFLRNMQYPSNGVINSHDLATETEGVLTAYSMPASMHYPDMGQKAKGERKRIPNNAGSISIFYASGTNSIQFSGSPAALCDALGAMCSGDLIRFSKGGNDYLCSSAGVIGGDAITVLPVSYAAALPSSAGPISSLEIVRSGCTNQLDRSAGEYVVYGTPAHVQENGPRRDLVNAMNACLTALPCSVNVPLAIQNDLISSGNPTEVIFLWETDGLLQMSSAPSFCETGTQLPGFVSFVLTDDGFLAYESNDGCGVQLVVCAQFVRPWIPHTVVEKVVSCAVSTYGDDWPYSSALYDQEGLYANMNSYENGERGKWRQVSTFDYRASTVTNERNYGSGWFDMTLFNWKFPAENDPALWVRNSTTLNYSANGEALEERNAIGTVSSVKYGYGHALPYLSAANCRSEHAHFESFEYNSSATAYEDGLPMWSYGGSLQSTGQAHSGKRFYRTPDPTLSTPLFVSKAIPVDQQLTDHGLFVKAWVRTSQGSLSIPPTGIFAKLDGSTAVTMERIARTGEWSLFQAHVPVPAGPTNVVCRVLSDIGSSGSGFFVDVDDVAIHPAEAAFSAYVHDPVSKRMVASFDDRHFGLFYQYDGKGHLMSKRVETERGMMTIGDSYMNTPANTQRP